MSAVMRTLPPQAVEEAEDAIRRACGAMILPARMAQHRRLAAHKDAS